MDLPFSLFLWRLEQIQFLTKAQSPETSKGASCYLVPMANFSNKMFLLSWPRLQTQPSGYLYYLFLFMLACDGARGQK